MAILSPFLRQSHTNLLINGAMPFAQRIGDLGSSVGLTGTRIDRWSTAQGIGALTTTHVAQSPTLAQSGVYSDRAARFAVSTSAALPATSSSTFIEQRIEGTVLREGDGIEKDYVLLFWMRANAAHTLSYSLKSTGSGGTAFADGETWSQQFVTSSVWQRYAYVIPKNVHLPLHAGTGIGLSVFFSLATDTDIHGPAESWTVSGGSMIGVDGDDNFMASTDNWLEVTQVALIPFESGRIHPDLVNQIEFSPHKILGPENEAVYRYYEHKRSPLAFTPANTDAEVIFFNTAVITTNSGLLPVAYRAPKRVAAHTVNIYDDAQTLGRVTTLATGGAPTNNILVDTPIFKNERYFRLAISGSPAPGDAGWRFSWEALAEL